MKPAPGLVLLVAVLAMSWGGPLVRYATAPALVVAGWRVGFSVLLIGLILLVRRGRSRPARVSRRDRLRQLFGILFLILGLQLVVGNAAALFGR